MSKQNGGRTVPRSNPAASESAEGVTARPAFNVIPGRARGQQAETQPADSAARKQVVSAEQFLPSEVKTGVFNSWIRYGRNVRQISRMTRLQESLINDVLRREVRRLVRLGGGDDGPAAPMRKAA